MIGVVLEARNIHHGDRIENDRRQQSVDGDVIPVAQAACPRGGEIVFRQRRGCLETAERRGQTRGRSLSEPRHSGEVAGANDWEAAALRQAFVGSEEDSCNSLDIN